MTAEERAALIDRLAPLIIEERRKAAEQNPKRPPWYMMNIAHPVIFSFSIFFILLMLNAS